MTIVMESNTKKPAGRPVGGKRQLLSQWSTSHTRFTMGQVVRELGWTMRDANDTIRRAIDRNELTVKELVAQPGCKRRVAVYARPESMQPAQDLGKTFAAWVK